MYFYPESGKIPRKSKNVSAKKTDSSITKRTEEKRKTSIKRKEKSKKTSQERNQQRKLKVPSFADGLGGDNYECSTTKNHDTKLPTCRLCKQRCYYGELCHFCLRDRREAKKMEMVRKKDLERERMYEYYKHKNDVYLNSGKIPRKSKNVFTKKTDPSIVRRVEEKRNTRIKRKEKAKMTSQERNQQRKLKASKFYDDDDDDDDNIYYSYGHPDVVSSVDKDFYDYSTTADHDTKLLTCMTCKETTHRNYERGWYADEPCHFCLKIRKVQIKMELARELAREREMIFENSLPYYKRIEHQRKREIREYSDRCDREWDDFWEHCARETDSDNDDLESYFC
jgi:hypothetical protein